MAERSLTLLEIHFDEASVQLGSRTFGTRTDETDEADAGNEAVAAGVDATDESARCPGRTVGGAVLVGLVLVALAGIAWKLLGETDLEAATDLDELAE